MKENIIIWFLRTTHKRFVLKSPTYFKWFTNICLIFSLIAGLPEFLEAFNIVLPAEIQMFADRTVAIAAGAMALVAKLTVEDPEALK